MESPEEVDLVISYAEYQSRVIHLRGSDTSITISLEPKIAENENVTVRSYEKNGWERWGFTFSKLFLGNSSFADQCKIENPKDIRFSFSEQERVLRATARKTIINHPPTILLGQVPQQYCWGKSHTAVGTKTGCISFCGACPCRIAGACY